uniref:Zf-AD domain-containing protein n=1 Tax=Mesocestoides corti TaxID=53468 RepID=A0A5K3EP70_MESCO
MLPAKALSAKLKLFQEINCKIVLGVGPIPSSSDVVNLLKYFQSCLYGFIRDNPNFNRAV